MVVVHVLHNPAASRSAQREVRSVIARIRADGERVVDLGADTPEASTIALRDAVERQEIEQLVIAGGDGLVHLAIQHVAKTAIAVTIAPVGSGNDFARALRGAFGEGKALEGHGRTPTPIDLIQVSTSEGHLRWVASVAIAGFPADINRRANTMGRRWGSNVYTLAAIGELPSFSRRTFELSIDGIPVTSDSAMLAIGNTKYFGGGMLPCPDALPNDGVLQLTSIEGVGRVGLLPHLIGRAGGTADRKEVLRGVGQRIDVVDAGHDFWADGEPLGLSPLSFEAVPGALHVQKVGATS